MAFRDKLSRVQKTLVDEICGAAFPV